VVNSPNSNVVQIVSPVDGRVFAERPVARNGDVWNAVTEARDAQLEWRAATVKERAAACTRLVDAMLAMRDEIVPELAWQMGRPVSSGAGELRGFEERSRHMIAIAAEALAPVRPEPRDGFDRYIVREPLGIVLVVAPWNYPFLTAVNSIIPALMAGNAVLLKHASQTLLVGERFQMAADAAGLPDGLFRNLVLTHDQTAEMLRARLVDQVNFTGSVEGGRQIERAMAGTFTGAGLELGGKDPAYVRADADLAFAVENIVDGAFFNSGQSCCGIERVYVHRSVFAEFVDRAVALTRGYVLGDPLDTTTTLGPMVHGRAADFVRNQIAEAGVAGGSCLIDIAEFPRDVAGSPYMAPQIVVDVDHTMSLMRDESFGPVVGIMAVDGDDQAVELMNDSEFGLTASIWTADADAVRALGPRIETGTVYMNRADYLDPGLAWTGVKDTGRGVTLSALGYETLTRPKSYHLRLSTPS
jgi:acyl-CoA reductase-like NAD-dependent aldehyde dehydrogenase